MLIITHRCVKKKRFILKRRVYEGMSEVTRMEETRISQIRQVFTFPLVNLSVKQIVVLYLHGKNYTSPQIEKITGINRKTVRTIISRHKDNASNYYLSITKDFLSGILKLDKETKVE